MSTLTITIPDRDGLNPIDVAATATATPGLAVHAALGTGGWALTHIPTGRVAGWWADDDDSSRALACGAALGALGSWGTTDLAALPLRDAWPVVLEHGGWVTSGGRWWCLEHGEPVPVVFTGTPEVAGA